MMKTFQPIAKGKSFNPTIKFTTVLLFITIIIFNYSVYSQGLDNISMTITDSIVIKNKRNDVIKLLIRLEVDIKTNDSILIKNFFRIVPANAFVFDTVPINSKVNCRYNALFYKIENSHGEYIPPRLILIHSNQNDSYDNRKTFRYLDTLKLRYRKSRKRIVIFPNNDLIVRGDTSLFVYPNIEEFHYLQKGIYYLHLYYCNKDDKDNITLKLGATSRDKFRGFFQSNKVKVIVE